MLNNFCCEVPITTLKFEAGLKLIFLCLAFFERERVWRWWLFSSSVTCDSQLFAFVGTICYFFKEMKEGLAYIMRNWLDLPEKASVWSWGNNWKKMQDIDIAVKNLPYHYKLENWEYTLETFEMFKKKQPNLRWVQIRPVWYCSQPIRLQIFFRVSNKYK